jgi:hypothetical protein
VITIRASSLPTLFDCPARWQAIHIQGQRVPTTGKAQLGRAVHASTAVYDQAVIDEAGITPDEAKAAAVDVINRPDEDIDWEDSTPSEAEAIALALHDRYCTEIAPRQTYRAVEVTCSALEISDLGLTLTGTTDRIRETPDGELGISDIKTGKTAVAADGTVKTQGHGYQIGIYELLAEAASGQRLTAPGQIIGLNAAKTAKAQRAGVGEIANAREALLGTEAMPGVLEMASKLIHSGTFYGNPRSPLCSAKYCPAFKTCNYRR